MYKHPTDSLAALFIPGVILGLVNLLIFFQPFNLADRIASIATILIAIVGIVAILNNVLTNNAFSCASMLIYFILITSLILLGDTTLAIFVEKVDTEKLVESPRPLFYVSLFMTVLNLLYPLSMSIVYQCLKKFKYLKKLPLDSIYGLAPLLPGD